MEAKREDGSGTLLFSNLLLLGLEPGRVKKEQGLELADNMFRSTNVSCLDFVLHFLYCRLQRTELVRKVWGISSAEHMSEILLMLSVKELCHRT